MMLDKRSKSIFGAFIILFLTLPALLSFLFPFYENYRNSATSERVIDPASDLVYVLQCIRFNELSDADFDVAVVDPDDSMLTGQNIAELKKQGKIIIAYLSVGEAENYRRYWEKGWKEGNPVFIDEENPEWHGNYKVKYWNRQWQQILSDRLKEIIELGYDGVYMDVIDAYKYYEDKGIYFAEKEMVSLVIRISDDAKKLNPKFLVIPQNAEELVNNSGYLSSIDGIGRENLWFENDRYLGEACTKEVLSNILMVKNSGKFVFAINYSKKESNINEFFKLCRDFGFIPYIGKKELDTIEYIAPN